MRIARAQQQTGMALIAALFIMVVLAALGMMALRLNTTEQQAANAELLGLRAQSAAQALIEVCSNRVIAVGCVGCPATLNLPAFPGFTVRGTCQSVGAVFNLTATAQSGNYGAPDFVARSVTRSVP